MTLTREEILAMEPGPEMDQMIHRVIFKDDPESGYNHYSRGMSDAWEVAEKFETIEIKRFITDPGYFFCEIYKNGKWYRSYAETAPETIGKSGLLAELDL